MGLTYKENVPDTKESPVREMVKELKEFVLSLWIRSFTKRRGNWRVWREDEFNVIMDCVIMAVAHDEFKKRELNADNAR